MKNLHFLIGILGITIFSCDIRDNEVEPSLSFTRIYNNDDFNGSFVPLDVQQSADSGYLILGVAAELRPYILKTNATGDFEWDFKAETPYISPVPNLLNINGVSHFICMHETSLASELMRISLINENAEPESTLGPIYPLAAADVSDNKFLLLSYERGGLSTLLTSYNANLSEDEIGRFDVLIDVEPQIVDHVFRLGQRQLPFFVGEVEGLGAYYFNGFRNFNLSFGFVDANDLSERGIVNGIKTDAIISAAMQTSNLNFALSRQSFLENLLNPSITLDLDSDVASDNLAGSTFPELTTKAPVAIKKVTIDETDYSIYASNTKSSQIILLAFDMQGELLGTTYLGRNNPFEISTMIPTSDGGLAILGTTFTVGRFPRIILFKFSPKELRELVGL